MLRLLTVSFGKPGKPRLTHTGFVCVLPPCWRKHAIAYARYNNSSFRRRVCILFGFAAFSTTSVPSGIILPIARRLAGLAPAVGAFPAVYRWSGSGTGAATFAPAGTASSDPYAGSPAAATGRRPRCDDVGYGNRSSQFIRLGLGAPQCPREPTESHQSSSDWAVRVAPNRFPNDQ